MNSFLAAATKRNKDIRSFLRDASGANSVKYSAVKNEKHLIYIPYITETVNEDGVDKEVKSIISITAKVHEWNGADGKYKSTVCLDGVIREDSDGTPLNDGSCPFCNRIADAWDIFNIRKDREAQASGKSGAELEKYLEEIRGKLAEDNKAKAPREYMYILVAKFRQDKNGLLTKNDKGRPEFDLKVMRLTANRSEKILKTIENGGISLEGAELLFDYPNTEDIRHLYTDSVIVPAVRGTANSVITKFDGLEEEILEAAKKFTWDGIEKSFPELKGMTTKEAQTVMNGLFAKYDDYKKQLETNPNARYMEYLTSTANVPGLNVGDDAPAGEPAGQTANPAGLNVPSANTAAPTAPTAPVVPDVDAAFGSIGSL